MTTQHAIDPVLHVLHYDTSNVKNNVFYTMNITGEHEKSMFTFYIKGIISNGPCEWNAQVSKSQMNFLFPITEINVIINLKA